MRGPQWTKYISCFECGLTTAIHGPESTDEALVKHWNRRPAHPATGLLTFSPEETGVGEYCAPGPAAEQRPRFLLRFEDPLRGEAVFEDAQEARQAFARAEGNGWNCYLFKLVRRRP